MCTRCTYAILLQRASAETHLIRIFQVSRQQGTLVFVAAVGTVPDEIAPGFPFKTGGTLRNDIPIAAAKRVVVATCNKKSKRAGSYYFVGIAVDDQTRDRDAVRVYNNTETAQFVLPARTIVISVAQLVFVYPFLAIALALVARVVAVYSAVAPVFGLHAPGIVQTRERVQRTVEITCTDVINKKK